MKIRLISLVLCLALLATMVVLPAPGVMAAANVQFYTAAGTGAEALSAWESGNYTYIRLTTGMEMTLDGQSVVVDLNGNDLNVQGGGNLQVFDSANDTYDHTACGVVTVGVDVNYSEDLLAPNGNRYIALADGDKVTMHRLEMEITTISLRTSSASLYYKAHYACDKRIEQKVTAYGVAVSLRDVPGADFKKTDSDAYTVCDEKFVAGATVTSGTSVNILQPELSAAENLKRSRMNIYANAYIDLGDGPIMADTANVGKTTGVSASLQRVLSALDEKYATLNAATRGQLDKLNALWAEKGVEFGFVNIGKPVRVIDNSNLRFDAGTTNAWCSVCEKKVTWTALEESSAMVVAKDGYHYYLADDLTVSLSGSGIYAYLQAPDKTGHKACLHLNGHNLTSTKAPALHGSNGVLNVMGNGVVTGFQDSSTKSRGAAVQVNNYIKTNAVNLYGGTYRKAEGSHVNAAVIGIRSNGGGVFVYEGVTIDATSGYAIYGAAPNRVDHRLGLYGCTVNGNVEFLAPEVDGYQTKLEIHNTTINGTITLSEDMAILLSGKLAIDKIVIPEEMRLTTGGIAQGSVIGIDADGDFVDPIGNAGDYTGVFVPTTSGKCVKVYDNVLACTKDYISDLQFASGTTDAYCPVCDKTVPWTALANADEPFKPTLGEHYYLPENLTYTGSGAAFLIMNGGEGKMVCVHLNGHTLTAPDSRVFYGSSSILNVMGTGIVSGRAPDTYGPGSAVQSNTSNKNGTINLYSGTYKQASGAASTEYTVNLNDAGKINIYRDATVESNVSGNAYRVATPRSNPAAGAIYGAKIEGNVALSGSNAEKSYDVSLILDGAKISGTVDIDGINTVTVLHSTKIGLLDMENTTVLTLDRIRDGADITVKNVGVFSNNNPKAGNYLDYFATPIIDDKIVNKDGELAYKVNYTAKLQLDGKNQGWCPVCRKNVSWTALTDTDVLTVAQDGYHYYLTDDIVHSGTATACFKAPETKYHTACLHLNGYDITAESVPAIYGSSGVLNVMGDGVVSGYAGNNRGGAVQLNNYLTYANAVNLYSGTYRKGPNAVSGGYVAAMASNGGGLYVYEDAVVEGNNAIYVGVPHASGDNKLGLYDCTVTGNIVLQAPDASRTTKTIFNTNSATINGTVNIYGNHDVTFTGRTKITKLSLAAGTVVNFTNMLPGSAITVDANGIFTTPMEQADEWIGYISIDQEGDILIVRDKCFYQGAQAELPSAEDADIQKLQTLYAGREVRYGEMHDHTNSAPNADGFHSVAEWKAKMIEIGMDFTTIVDHRQSVHMYDPDWDSSMFIGGSEPSTRITDQVFLENNNFHYNMIFANAADLETVFKTFPGYKYKEQADGNGGTVVTYWLKRQEFLDTATLVRELGGFFVAVHPKYAGYLVSDNPLDYYFGEYTGIEITTGTGGNMAYEENEKAYQLWLDLLDLGKKVYATSGSDFHKLPNASALTTLYGDKRDAQAYVDLFRSGDFAPGWVGLRMAIADTTMGGTTSFDGQRLVFSVGDMYDIEINDGYSDSYCYQADHTYSVQLYDDGGLLMESIVDPSEMNYFAIDADPDAKFYRVVVWDLTENTRVAVGNPIWNQ